jgi:hypothetical protein
MISLTLVRRIRVRPSIVFDAFPTPCYANRAIPTSYPGDQR